MKGNSVDANVTLGDRHFPCPICQEMREIRYDKNSKPYCTCNDCGVQLFIRGKIGIRKLENLISNIEYKLQSKELINLIDYYKKLSEKLKEIRKRKPILGGNDDLDAQDKAVEKQLMVLRNKFKSM